MVSREASSSSEEDGNGQETKNQRNRNPTTNTTPRRLETASAAPAFVSYFFDRVQSQPEDSDASAGSAGSLHRRPRLLDRDPRRPTAAVRR